MHLIFNQPDVLFVDEPTGALNSSTTIEVMDIMDGNIHDELALGKYETEENKKSYREKKLSDWLEKQGF